MLPPDDHQNLDYSITDHGKNMWKLPPYIILMQTTQ